MIIRINLVDEMRRKGGNNYGHLIIVRMDESWLVPGTNRDVLKGRFPGR